MGDIAPRPLLLVQGDADESVPLEHTRELFDRAGEVKSLHILSGAPQGVWGTQWESEVLAHVAEWFTRYL